METRKKGIDRAGCLPYYIKDGEIQILFMQPKDAKHGGKCFQISKGKREKDESPLENSMREAGEELGLFQGNVTNKHHLGKFLGRTDVYVVKIEDPDQFGDPTTPEEVKAVKWMTPEEFQAEGRGIHKAVVKAAVRWIKKKEGIK